MSASGRAQIATALALVDAFETRLVPLDEQLRDYARRQPGCPALMTH